MTDNYFNNQNDNYYNDSQDHKKLITQIPSQEYQPDSSEI